MIGIDAEYIAFTGLAEVPLDIADPIDAIARNPTERHASRKGALDHLDRKLRLGRKADVVRHICGLQANRIVGPALRQIFSEIERQSYFMYLIMVNRLEKSISVVKRIGTTAKTNGSSKELFRCKCGHPIFLLRDTQAGLQHSDVVQRLL